MSNRTYSPTNQILQSLFDRPIYRTVLPNGLTVIAREDSGSPLISAQAWVKTGSIHEGDMLGCGLSHYLEHMLFKGTALRSAQELTREIHGLGGYVNAYTTFDRTVYYIDAPSEAARQTVDILQDLVLQAAIPAEEALRERDVILREIDMGRDDPDRQVLQGLLGTAFRKHPYQYPVIGHKALFESVSPEELQEYYRQRYSPANTVLVVVGDIAIPQLMEWVEAGWGQTPQRRLQQPLVPEEPEQLAPRTIRLEGDVNVHRGVLAWKTPGLTHPDTPALDMLASILGSGDSALLWQEIRDGQRRVHDIDASAWTPLGGGLFWVWFTADSGGGDEARQAILDFLEKRMREPLAAELLDKARRRALVGEINARKSMSGQAGRLGLAEVGAGDLNYPSRYFRRLEALGVEDLLRVGREIFQEHRLTEAALTPAHKKTEEGPDPRMSSSTLPPFEEVKLSNGVRLVLQEDHRLPKIHMRAALRGGPLYEPEGQRGITQLLATLLTRDTEQLDAAAVADRIESIGGDFTDFAGNNSFGLAVEVLPGDFETGLAVLREGLLSPGLVEETFHTERDAQIAYIEEMLDDVVSRGQSLLREHLFGKHPFCVNAFGSGEDLKALTPAHLRRFYQSLLVGPNLVIAVSGDFDGTAVREAMEAAFSRMPANPFTPVSGALERPAATGRHTVTVPREQAVLFSAFLDVGITHPQHLDGELLDECFSGMSSRLFQRVREEQGMAYFVSATRTTGVDCGMFSLFAGTHPDQVEAVFSEFSHELDRVREGRFDEGELQRGKTRLKAQKITGLQSAGARALQAALNALYGLPVNDWINYPARLDALTPDDLQAFARDRLREDQRLDLVVRPD